MKQEIQAILFLLTGIIGFSQEHTKPIPALTELTSFQNVRDFTISKNQEEIYFTIQSPTEDRAVIAVIKKNKKEWTTPEITPFSGNFRNIEPFLTPGWLAFIFCL